MNLTLRAPTAADYDVVASWIPDASACARWAGPQVRFPLVASDLPSLLAAPGGGSFCLSEGRDRPVGFGQFWVKAPGSVHLGRIIVSPQERGRGLAKVLCQLLMAEATRSTGAETITLNVSRDNAAAVAVYAKLGFLVVEAKSTADVLAMEAKSPYARTGFLPRTAGNTS